MTIFNTAFGSLFDLIFYFFQGMNPWVGMIVISFLTSLLMLAVYRFSSNQAGIKNVKNKIKAHLLELRLYKDDLATTFKAQGSLLKHNFRYIGYAFMPMLVMIVPLILIIIQLEFWFDYRSLHPGEQAILKVKLNDTYDPMDLDISLEPSPGIVIETLPVRIAEEKEVSWRLKATENGIHDLIVRANGEAIPKRVAVGGVPLAQISPVKVQKGFLDELLYPAEPPIPKDSPLQRIEISYPFERMGFFGWHLHWLIPYFALSIILGFALKGFFKIEI